MRGVDHLCEVLAQQGVEVVFGLPGTQNISLFDAIKRSGISSFVSTSEMNAAFAANGYARTSGHPSVLAVIPGPGFTYALTGIAEARLDSVPMVCLIGEPARHPDRRFQLQQLDQADIVGPLVKAYHRLERAEDCGNVIRQAFADAIGGEPGPVVVELSSALNSDGEPVHDEPPEPVLTEEPSTRARIQDIAAALAKARRPLLFLGQGTMIHGDLVRALRERIGAAVIATTSGRGIVSEAEEFVLATDLRDAEVVNELIARADIILALGVKLSHNGCAGFQMHLPEERFIHVDADPTVPEANFPARIALVSRMGAFLQALLEILGDAANPAGSWSAGELAEWQQRLDATDVIDGVNPRVANMRETAMPEFFKLLRSCMPAGSHLVCDSGMHQMLARRHYAVFEPAGLLVPTDFQSMGYGIPAAIGAKVAHPRRAVAALVGDGGLAINGPDLLSAVRDQLALPVFVFVDGHFGLIRHQQIENFGTTTDVKLQGMNIESFAAALGTGYARAGDQLEADIRKALSASGPTLFEIPLVETADMRLHQAKRATVESVQRALGPERSAKLKKFVRGIAGKDRS